MVILDALDYDVCVGTPDHFFSYLSNVTTVDDQVTLRQMIDQARSALSHHTLGNKHIPLFIHRTNHLSFFRFVELLSSYPSSIVSLSVLLMISPVSSYDMMSELIKSFVVHKKDQSHYLVSGYTLALPLLIFFFFSLIFRHSSNIVQFNFKVLFHHAYDLIHYRHRHTCSTVIYEIAYSMPLLFT